MINQSFITSYSQNREDIIIDAFFKGKSTGFYVDVGANHPVIDSVTKLFYLKGWTGVNIEPNSRLAELLEADRPKDTTLVKGVSNRQGTAKLRIYENGDGLSTYSDDVKNEAGTVYDSFKVKYQDVETEIDTLENIFASIPGLKKIDFMKVDVEGMEHEVLSGNDWAKYRPELICIEANHVKVDWRTLLDKVGYKKFFNDGLNDYYAEEHSERVGQFNFPESVFMVYPKIMPFVPHKDELIHTIDQIEPVHDASTLKQDVLNSLTAFSHSSRILLRRKITILKRRQLDEKIKKSIKNGERGMIKTINYITPKIVSLNLMLFCLNVLFKLGYKLQARRGL